MAPDGSSGPTGAMNSTSKSINLFSTYRRGGSNPQPSATPAPGKASSGQADTRNEPPRKQATVSPEDSAGLFSRATWHWLTPLLILGYKKPLENEDVYPLPKDFTAEALSERFQAAWEEEMSRWTRVEETDPVTGKTRVSWKPRDGTKHPTWFGIVKHTEPSVLRACARVFWIPFTAAGIMRGISDATQVTNPILLNFLISYIVSVGSPTNTYSIGYGLGFLFAIFSLTILNAFAMHNNWWLGSKVGFGISRSLITAVYSKSLRLSQGARQKYFSGKTVNMMSTDTARIDLTVPQLHALWAAPLLIIASLIVLVIMLGISGLIGFLVLVIVVPISGQLMRISMRVRKKTNVLTDERVKLTQECIGGIRVVKFMSWVDTILERITALRLEEMANTRKLLIIRASLSAMVNAQPAFASVAMFGTYTALGNEMTVARTFSALALMQVIRYPLMFLPMALSQAADALVSIHRIQGLLLAEELGSRTIKDSPEDLAKLEDGSVANDDSIVIGSPANFVWDDAPEDNESDGKKAKADKKERRRSGATSGSEATAKDRDEEQMETMFEGPMGKAKTAAPLGTTMLNARVNSPATLAAASRAVTQVDGGAVRLAPVAKGFASEHNFGLHDVELKVPRGSLVAIVGSVGSGKSSLIQAIIGEMRCSSGAGAVAYGKVSYAPQTAWIVNDTVRGNIVFGNDFDEERYERTVRVCALERDFSMLPAGDSTEVGERGINLSGGQKARLSLARATYAALSQKVPSECIVVMDDPLSAVDAHVGKHLMEQCITGALAGSTRILATHQVHVVDRADWVIVLDHGKILEQGRFEDLMRADGGYLERLLNEFAGGKGRKRGLSHSRRVSEARLGIGERRKSSSLAIMVNGKESLEGAGIPAEEEGLGLDEDYDTDAESEGDEDDDSETEEDEATPPPKKPAGELIVAEEREVGSVPWAVYKNYIQASGGWAVWLTLAVMLAGIQCSRIGADVWLSFWSTNRFPISNTAYTLIYFAIGFCQAVFIFGAFFFCAFVGYFASLAIHEQAMRSVARAPVAFFDTTPAGRIVNRFSRDVDVMDNLIPEMSRVFFAFAAMSAGTLLYISVAAPWFLIPAVPLVALYIFMTRFYRYTAREIRRLEAISRSPLYNHLGETLNGLSTIRAFGAQDRFLAENRRRVNNNGACYYHMIAVSRWLSFRLEAISAMLILATMLFAVLGTGTGLSSTLLSLAVTYSLQVTSSMQWTAENGSMVEREFNSIERLTYYGKELPQEAPAIIEGHRPPKGWPNRGSIEFKHVALRYRPDLPPVLRDVSLDIHPGERIGIVGRTGAGKSSIIQSLFRMTELSEGQIIIDGVDISTIGLHDLRSNLAIIPQDSVLFTGTLRYNLDPFNEFSDEQLWDVLSRAGDLKAVISAAPLKLDMVVADQGENFSQGQRQLLCMARAMLRDAQIIVLDEATASVDVATDAMIQRTIREDERFRGKTIITIAHRLATIADYSRVVGMKDGQVMEVGTPAELLAKPDGLFRSLVDETGESNAEAIRSIALRKDNSSSSLPPITPVSILSNKTSAAKIDS
ncbi:P-loop containing nucleoside triphosphate hydrolase protein [Hyaloraphidium curvatum]|nr:P-loop containing nucleoside triphosphate hydrolase protein [Hyaloraphidium curvatum]